jgi:polyhydroxyalkanoate synthesis regulator phasin
MLDSTNLNNTTEAAKGLASILTDATKKIENMSKSFKDMGTGIKDITTGPLKDLVDKTSLFDDGVIKASRSLGQSLVMARSLETGFGRVAENIVKIGGDLDDVYTIFKNISTEIGRSVYLSENMLTNVALLEKSGVAEESIKAFTKLYDNIGGTFEESTKQQMLLVNQAKSYGLNVGQFMTAVSSQLTKINQYGFPNGVKDLAEMVAKSKMLGANIEVAAGFADKIATSPEAAMDVAAQLQTLGGSFASLADPMELLYLAQNDLAGLNDKLIQASRGVAQFNEETGQFEVNAAERFRLKQAATIFGTDSAKILETATKLAKQEEIIKRLDFRPEFQALSPEQQEVIASYAQISKGGKVTIEGKSIEQLGKTGLDDVLKKLQGASSQFGESQDQNIQMIQQNMSSVEQVTAAQNLYSNGITLATIQTEGFAKQLDVAGDVFAGVNTQLAEFKKVGATALLETLNKATQLVLAKGTGSASESIQNLSDIATKTSPARIDLSTEKPIKIDINSSFQISDVTNVARTSIIKMVEERLTELGYTVNNKTGADKPY